MVPTSLPLQLGSGPVLVVYAVGALFGVATVLYFTRDVLLSLSVTSKTAIPYALAAVAILFALGTDRTLPAVALFLVAAGLYVGATWFLFKTYDLGRIGTVLVLASSALLFVGLGAALESGALAAVSLPVATGASGALLVGLAALSALDWAEGDPVVYRSAFESMYEDETIGRVVVSNDGRFRRRVDVPELHARVRVGDARARVPVARRRVDGDDRPTTLPGGTELTYEYVLTESALRRSLDSLESAPPDALPIRVVSARDGRRGEAIETDTEEPCLVVEDPEE